MKTTKRLISLLLIMALVASACGCGMVDKVKKVKTKKVNVSVKSFEDVVEAVPKYDEGKYEVSLKVDFNDYVNVDILASGKRNGTSMTLDSYEDSIKVDLTEMIDSLTKTGAPESFFDMDEVTLKSSYSDILTIADKKAYINLDTLIGSTFNLKTNLGYYGILLPLPDEKDYSDYSGKFFKLLAEAAGILTENSANKEKDGAYSIEFESAEDLKDGVKALLEFASENAEDIADLLISGKDLIDLENYAEYLKDDLKDDIEDLAEYLGDTYDVDDYKDKLLSELNSIDFDDVTEEIGEVDEESLAKEIKKGADQGLRNFDRISDAYWDEIFESYDQIHPDITLKAASDEFKINIKVDTVIEKQDLTVEFDYTFIPQEVEISAPKNASKMKDIAKELENLKDDFTEKIDRFKPLLSEKMGEDITLSSLFDIIDDELNAGSVLVLGVGIMAPAYLKYVEKSRFSTDLDTIDCIVKGAEVLCTDDDYEDYVYTGDKFIIENDNGTVSIYINSSSQYSQEALKAWREIANVGQTISLKSKAGKRSYDRIVGTLQDSGAIYWTVEDKGYFLSQSSARSFVNKLINWQN